VKERFIRNESGQATKRLIKLFDNATEQELLYGLSWYDEAHAWCWGLSMLHALPTHAVAGITAALSPQRRWATNKKVVEQFLHDGNGRHTRLASRRAWRIRNGEDPDDVLGGPKVQAFYSNLAFPATSQAVCIDRHAFDAAAGQVTNDQIRKQLDLVGEYERISDMYRSAGQRLHMQPHVVQAVVWTTWRNRNTNIGIQD
jgi:hypothetical protein